MVTRRNAQQFTLDKKTGCCIFDLAGREISAYQTMRRQTYALHFGAIPAGYQVVSTCDSKHCVNPQHMMIRPWRVSAKK